MQWDKKELDTQFTPNIFLYIFGHPILKSWLKPMPELVGLHRIRRTAVGSLKEPKALISCHLYYKPQNDPSQSVKV